MAPVVKNLPANAEGVREVGSILGLGRSSGTGCGNPLQYSCLENPMDRRGWWVVVHGSQRVGHDWSNLVHTAQIPLRPAKYLHLWKCQERGYDNKTAYEGRKAKKAPKKSFQILHETHFWECRRVTEMSRSGDLSVGSGIGGHLMMIGRVLEAPRMSPPARHRWGRPAPIYMWAQKLWMKVGDRSLGNNTKWKPSAHSGLEQCPELVSPWDARKVTWLLLHHHLPLIHWCTVKHVMTKTKTSNITTVTKAQRGPQL